MDAHKAIVQELGLRVTAAAAAETYGIVEMLAGDAAAAERELATGYGLLEEIGETQNFPDLAAKLADALYVQGRTIKRSSSARSARLRPRRTIGPRASSGGPWAKLLRGAASWRRPRRWRGKR